MCKNVSGRALILLIGTLILAPLAVSAQDRFADNGADWWHRVALQAAVNINSPNVAIQQIGLENLIYLMVFYREYLPVDYLFQALVRAYVQALSEVNRTLARAALITMGTPAAMAYLRDHGSRRQEQLARVALIRVLHAQREHVNTF